MCIINTTSALCPWCVCVCACSDCREQLDTELQTLVVSLKELTATKEMIQTLEQLLCDDTSQLEEERNQVHTHMHTHALIKNMQCEQVAGVSVFRTADVSTDWTVECDTFKVLTRINQYHVVGTGFTHSHSLQVFFHSMQHVIGPLPQLTASSYIQSGVGKLSIPRCQLC